MKIIVNRCYGGYGLSVRAKSDIAKIKGKEIYFFKGGLSERYIPASLEEAEKELFVFDYTVPNPQDYRLDEIGDDGTYKEANERASSISIDFSDRSDKDIISVVEKLGKGANSRFSDLEIVEIPDDVDWEIDDYDGIETIHEKHRSW